MKPKITVVLERPVALGPTSISGEKSASMEDFMPEDGALWLRDEQPTKAIDKANAEMSLRWFMIKKLI